ncbi:cell division protein FtsZ [Radicibacter daui]|uniref:cell division protein FtsZ n=1 Tax=Radicibacter daui TaxID=3064829 RepID=UPI004046FF03
MALNISVPQETIQVQPRITVVGVGGAGGNAVNNMIKSELEGCEFLICNTDAQALNNNLAARRIQLGPQTTNGLGAGSRPEVGKVSAEESIDEVMEQLEGSNMVFITAGMGGGTGTGAAPVIAQACRDRKILTVGVVTKPFSFEGAHRQRMAETGIQQLQQHVDTLIIIPNQNLFRIANEKTTFADAFKMADDVLFSGVRSVTDLMVRPGLINLDFADIRSVMTEMGKAMMGTGECSGDNRSIEAAELAINNPLLDDVSLRGARGVLINITGGMDMTLMEVDSAANRIRDEVDPEANIIFGSTFDPEMDGRIRISVVATGIDVQPAQLTRPGTATFSTIDGGRAAPKAVETASRTTVSAPATPRFVPATPAVATQAATMAGTATFTASHEGDDGEGLKATGTDGIAFPVPQPVAEVEEEAPVAMMAEPAPQPAPQAAAEAPVAPRGTFIPPRAIEPEPAPVEIPAAPRAAAIDPFVEADLVNATGRVAHEQAHRAEPRRPSLINRLLGKTPESAAQPVAPRREPQPSLAGLREQAQSRVAPQATAPAQRPAAPAQQAPAPQQRAAAPEAQSRMMWNDDDTLSIPSFLRRQAN